jgi:hypothetical protein
VFAWVVVKEALARLEEISYLSGRFYSMKVNNKMILFGLGVLCWGFWKSRIKWLLKRN